MVVRGGLLNRKAHCALSGFESLAFRKMKEVDRVRAYIKVLDDDYLIAQSVSDVDLEWRIPRRVIKMGDGIIAGPWKVFTLGWHGWVITFSDKTCGFQPDA